MAGAAAFEAEATGAATTADRHAPNRGCVAGKAEAAGALAVCLSVCAAPGEAAAKNTPNPNKAGAIKCLKMVCGMRLLAATFKGQRALCWAEG
jgi:hypothetical protein